MALDDLLDDGESHAGAAAELVAGVQAFEDAEDGLVVLFGDADAVVAHVEDGAMADEMLVLLGRLGSRGPGRCHSRSRSTSPACRCTSSNW